MANIRMIIQSSEPVASLTARLNNEPKADNANILDFFKSYINILRSGQHAGSVMYVMATEVAASGTAQCVSVIEDDTVTIGAKVLTAKDVPASQDEFLVGADDIETSANLAACILANTDLNKWLSASSDGVDTVTISCLVPGKQGNNIPLASSGSTIVVSGAFLASGADGVFRKEVL